MKSKTSTRIEPGELTLHRGKLYLAATTVKGKPCTEQCSLHDGQRCDGYCWRWDNPDGIVFRFILPEMLVKEATEVVQTPDLIGDHLRRLEKEDYDRRNAEYRARKRAERVPKKRGVKPKGNIEERSNGFRATIIIDGVRYRYSDASREAVDRWLDKKKKQQ